MGNIRKPRNMNTFTLEHNDCIVVDQHFYGAGEALMDYSVNMNVCTSASSETYGKWCELQVYTMCVPISTALIFSPSVKTYMDVKDQLSEFKATDFNAAALNRMASNLLINMDSDGLDFFGAESEIQSSDQGAVRTATAQLQADPGTTTYDVHEGSDLVTGTVGAGEEFFGDAIKTWGPSRIYVPYKDELIFLQPSVVDDSNAKARKEYNLRKTFKINGGHASGGFFLLILRRSAIPGEDDPEDSGVNTLDRSQEWRTAGSEDGSTYLLSNMIVGDHLRVDNMIREQNTKSGSLARSLLFGGTNMFTETDIITSEKYNVALKSKTTIATPYSMIGTGLK